jgi:hypothetical protein
VRGARDRENLVFDAFEGRFGDAEELFAEFGDGRIGVAAALGTVGEVIFVCRCRSGVSIDCIIELR